VDANFTNLNDDKVEASGDSMTGNLSFGDNNKVILGSGSDLQLYHDGSDSFIVDQGTGNLAIRASSSLYLQSAAGSTYFQGVSGGAVTLYNSGSAKLATTSTGIDVTGTAVVDGLTSAGDAAITGSSSGSTVLTLTSNALADTPLMVFERTGGAVAGKLAYEDTNTAMSFGTTTNHELKFLTNNTARAQFTGGGNLLLQTDTVAYSGTALNIGDTSDSQNGVQITTSTTGNGYILFGDGSGADAYRGQIQYEHTDDKLTFRSGGAVRQNLSGTETVFNEGSTDTDFRVESNSNTHALFVDAGNNRIGLGTSSPQRPLHLSIGTDNTAARFESSDTEVALEFIDLAGTAYFRASGDYIKMGATASDSLAIDSSGNLTLTNTGAGAGAGPYLNLHRNSASPLAGDAIGVIQFQGEDSVGNLTSYATIDSEIYDPNNGTEDGRLVLKTSVAGSLANRLYLNFGETVFNEDSNDLDFRVESNNNVNMLFVDAGNDRVGVGGAPSSPFHVQSGTTNNVATFTSTDSTAVIMMQDNAGNAQFGVSGSTARIAPSSSYAVLEASQSAVVLNNAAQDTDFRVESDTNANAFFLDATNGNIGMGGTSNVPLNIFRNGAGNTELLRLTNNNTNNHNFYVYVNDDDNMVRFGSTGDNGGNFAILESTNTNDSIIFYTAGGATFNELGADSDFRVESNNSAYAVYVDAAQDSVGILTNATDAALNVNSQNSSKDAIRIVGSGGNNFITGYGNQGNIAFDISEVGAEDPGKIRLYNNGGAVHQISAKASEGVMFNDGGMDMDFRVESDNRSHMLFVDAGSDSVTIGNTPYSVYSKSPQFGVNYGLAPWMSVGNASDGLVVLGSGGIGSPSVGSQDYMAYLAHNAFRDTDGAFLPIRTGAIGKAVLKISGGGSSGDVSTGGMFLDYAAAGSGSISWTRLMSVDGSTKSLVVNQGGATFNEAGNDSDFRVESNSNTHMLFVDGSNNSVSIGTANDYTGMLNLSNAYGDYCVAMQDDEVNTAFVLFRNNSGTSVGSILRSGTSTNYNTTSDARLKENIADADDAGELIDAIQVRQFDWITDGEHQRYGMVAQELNTVAPEAVSEGNAEEDMMGVDYSKLVPMLIKEIQSLRARVAQLESN
jgi:hypothetical protein